MLMAGYNDDTLGFSLNPIKHLKKDFKSFNRVLVKLPGANKSPLIRMAAGQYKSAIADLEPEEKLVDLPADNMATEKTAAVSAKSGAALLPVALGIAGLGLVLLLTRRSAS